MSRKRIALATLAATAFLTGFLLYPGGPLSPIPASAATITVDTEDGTIAADGDCSLGEAIENADANGSTHPDCAAGTGDDDIVFAAGVNLVTLTADLPDITDSDGLTIDGAGAVTINGATMYRPFNVLVKGSLTLQGLTITDAFGAIGGALSNSGNAMLVGTTITGNQAQFSGGGVRSSGTLTVVDSTISGNEVLEDTGSGGGIINFNGAVLLISSTIGPDNIAGQGGGVFNVFPSMGPRITLGAGGSSETGMITITAGSEIIDNFARHAGGGIGNSADLIVEDSDIAGNESAEDGGGIWNLNGNTVLGNVTVSGNTASSSGGGIYNQGTATISFIRSTLNNNHADFGGGIRGNTGAADFTNSTISGNSAQFGGGVYNGEDHTTTLTNTTVTSNSATMDGGGFYNPGDAPGDIVMINTIIAGQQSGGDCGGTGSFVSQGNNLDSDDTCNLNDTGDIPAGIANLGPLANNGGPTQTHAIVTGSDAIDAGNDTVCAAAPVDAVDQRGVTRPQGAHCDIGAFELQPTIATPTLTPSPAPTAGPTATATPAPTGSPTPTAEPTPTPTGGPGANAIWGDDDCNLAVAATDALKKLQDIASLPYEVEPGCPAFGDSVNVQPAGFGDLIWGDTDCDGDYDAVDALQILRSIAGLPVNQAEGCPEVGEQVLID